MSRLGDIERRIRPLTRDERDELASIAGTAERANRPSTLVVLAGIVFVVACSVLGLTATRQARAEADVQRRQTELTRLQDLVVDLETAVILAGDGPELPGPGSFLSRIQQAARAAGIESDLQFNETRSDRPGGIVLKGARYDIRHPSLAEPMDWVRRVTETIEGVNVSRIAITPRGEREWRFEVTFERYERAQ